MAKKPRANDETLGQLHQMVADELLRRVKSGEATAQELAQAIKFLQNNGIQGEGTDELEREISYARKVILPSFEDDELG